MAIGEDGCYGVDQSEQDCSQKCGLCQSVCPFGDTGQDEDSIGAALYSKQPSVRHSSECGYFLSCSVGYCSDLGQRLNGASGGITTAFLKRLIAQGVVDKVVCVTRHPGSDRLFDYSIVDNAPELGVAAKSAYYPVELSTVLREISVTPAKYAVVCLPCVAKALRLAQMRMPVLRERIAIIAGLTCGHAVSSYFAEYVASLAGAARGSVEEIVFRTKSPSLPASEIGTLIRWTNAGKQSRYETVLWSAGPGEAWSEHWFTPEACFYCDDAFAECADIAFMDAWLPEFVNDYKGTNLVVTRSESARSVIDAAVRANEIGLTDIDVERVVESQEGVVAFKRQRLAHRLWHASRSGLSVPVKRVAPSKAGDWQAAMRCEAEMDRAHAGLTQWRQCADFDAFQSTIRSIKGEVPTGIKAKRFLRRIAKRFRSVILMRS